MAHWDSKQGKTVYWSDTPYSGYPGWLMIDCGCCGGIEWGGETPSECRTCKGSGWLAKHIESKALAWYPGGPFCGVE